ncbi:MAG: septum formation protein Maf [Erysipelotrichaceae bacterium]|nr:septum formation protein Maf [Erysipelotrichaceae bacterium]
MTRIILASKSPRRRELMEMLKLPFEIIVSDIDEQIDYDNDLVKEIEKLSFRKADAVYQENKDALVIGSDTIVKIGNDVLGKPKSVEQAKEMLRELSDNTHEVVTGVTIICNDQVETFSSVANVTFYPLSEEEINEYVKTNEPMDKAGSYAIQGDGAKFIRSIEGDFYTIVGLPVGELYHRLKKYL